MRPIKLFTAVVTITRAAAKTIVIKSGDSGLVFSPNETKAEAGDVVEFQYWPRNHSVARSTFSNPCMPMSGPGAFFSGFFPVSSGKSGNVFRVTINDTNPVWYYCTQATGQHCQEGMVGVINPPSSTGNGNHTLTSYAAAAAKVAGNAVSPSKVEGGQVSASSSTSTNSSPPETSGGSNGSGLTRTSTTSGPSSTGKSDAAKSQCVSVQGLFTAALFTYFGVL